MLTGVSDECAEYDLSILQPDRVQTRFKTGIVKPIAKAVAGLHAKGVEETIAHIDAFVVFLIIFISSQIGVGRIGGNIFKTVCPAGSQSSGEILLAGKNIRQRIAALFAALDKIDQCGNVHGIQEGQIDHAAAVDNDDQILIMLGDKRQVFPFHIVQTIVTLFICAVIAFSGLASQHIDRGITGGSRIVFFCDRNAGRMPERGHGAKDLVEILHSLDAFFLLKPVSFIGIGIEAIKPVQPGSTGNFKTSALKSLLDRYAVAFPYSTGAGTALDGHPGAGAVKRNSFIF